MNLKRILRLKEIEEKERARRLKEIEEEIARLEKKRKEYERELEACKNMIVSSKGAMHLIFRQRAFVRRIQDIEKKVNELKSLREKERENLKDIKREEKAVSILKSKEEYESFAKSLKREFLQLGFIHLIKKGFKVVLLLSFMAFAESAVQSKLKEMEAQKESERLRELEKVIEDKLRMLVEERKRLEALRKRPLTEEEEKEVKKLIKIVSKTPSDEAGAILNEVKPRIAAEILIRLKERQAGQILAAMDPKKAAKVTEIIMSWRKKSAGK